MLCWCLLDNMGSSILFFGRRGWRELRELTECEVTRTVLKSLQRFAGDWALVDGLYFCMVTLTTVGSLGQHLLLGGTCAWTSMKIVGNIQGMETFAHADHLFAEFWVWPSFGPMFLWPLGCFERRYNEGFHPCLMDQELLNKNAETQQLKQYEQHDHNDSWIFTSEFPQPCPWQNGRSVLCWEWLALVWREKWLALAGRNHTHQSGDSHQKDGIQKPLIIPYERILTGLLRGLLTFDFLEAAQSV